MLLDRLIENREQFLLLVGLPLVPALPQFGGWSASYCSSKRYVPDSSETAIVPDVPAGDCTSLDATTGALSSRTLSRSRAVRYKVAALFGGTVTVSIVRPAVRVQAQPIRPYGDS